MILVDYAATKWAFIYPPFSLNPTFIVIFPYSKNTC